MLQAHSQDSRRFCGSNCPRKNGRTSLESRPPNPTLALTLWAPCGSFLAPDAVVVCAGVRPTAAEVTLNILLDIRARFQIHQQSRPERTESWLPGLDSNPSSLNDPPQEVPFQCTTHGLNSGS